ncbi:MAG: efflux RND transporter periplasmic adaptor subunit [Acidobacteriota bacterium]
MKTSIQTTDEIRDSQVTLPVELPTDNEDGKSPISEKPDLLIGEPEPEISKPEESPKPEGTPELQTSDAVQPSHPSSKRKAVSRVIFILLILALVTVGYLQRDRLSKFFAASAGSASVPKPERKVLYWQDPMHPAYTSDKPGKAPDCGMDLVPVYEDGMDESSLPDGTFRISPEKQQLIGVTYGEVTYKRVSRVLKAVGKVDYDETKIVRVHPKVEGWIENVFVDFVGKEVKQGQPLLSIYSPELVSTQQEYLIARKGRIELSESPFAEAVSGSDSLYEATRRRLQLWDISEEQIQELEKRGTPTKAMALYAPADGFVLARNAYAKQRVTPDVELYSIVDLSTVWLVAEIYQNEAPDIRIGQTATFTLSYFPNQTFKGNVAYIYPQMDNETRTLKIRIDVANPQMLLKPEMYANVEIQIDYGKQIVVPQEAVMDSGSEQMVFVGYEGGYLEPRKVQLGENVDGHFIVLSGLKAGERIVTSANFLIDSESKLKSAAAGMGMPGMNHGGSPADTQKPAAADHSQHQQGGQSLPPIKPENHSQHQPKTQKQADHSQHQPKVQKPEDHSQHQPNGGSAPPQAQSNAHSQHQAKPARKVLYWYDPMHPDYKSAKPGKAPDCGMDLVPKYDGEK